MNGTPVPSCKVLRIITRLNVGGPALHTVLLTRELCRFGYGTTLVAGACEAADGDMSYLLSSEDAVCWVPSMSRSVHPLKNLRALGQIWRTIRREKPTIVHTHTAMAGCLGRIAALLAGVPVVVHTFHGNSLRGYFSPAVEQVFLGIEKLLARFTDSICVVSEQQRSELCDRLRVVPRSRCRVVPLGLDLEPFLQLSPPALDDGRLRVGWFGRLVPVKNVSLLIQIAEAVLKRTRSVEFHVAGDGSERAQVEAAGKQLAPNFIWHGWQRDITHIIGRCHVLLQTSRNEGTPVALIQGMAAARPFVSTAVGGLVDMVSGPLLERAGGCAWYENGILADPEPNAFVNALLAISGNGALLQRMCCQARQFAAARHQKTALIAALDSLYRELLIAKMLETPSAIAQARAV